MLPCCTDSQQNRMNKNNNKTRDKEHTSRNKQEKGKPVHSPVKTHKISVRHRAVGNSSSGVDLFFHSARTYSLSLALKQGTAGWFPPKLALEGPFI